MAKALKPSPDQLEQCPISDLITPVDSVPVAETEPLEARQEMAISLKSLELKEKLEGLRLVVLDKMSPLFSGWSPIYAEKIAGKRISWSRIDEFISEIILKRSSIKSGVPEGSDLIKEMIEGDIDPISIDETYEEIARALGFPDYDEMVTTIEMGKESEKTHTYGAPLH